MSIIADNAMLSSGGSHGSARSLILCVVVCISLAGQTPTNGDFETGSPGRVPPGWSFGSSGEPGFTGVIVNQGCLQGAQCVQITGPASPAPASFGTLTTSLPMSPHILHRLRFKAAVRVGDPSSVAQMWMRVDRKGGGYSFFDNMDNRPISSTSWNYYTIEAPIAEDTSAIYLGVFLRTSGQAWIDDVTIEDLGVIRTDPYDPPTPLSEAGLANVIAFAKLAGYVRYFHPSDQSAVQLDWETFLIDGVRAVEPATGPEELAARLQSLFDPIAPTIRVFPYATDPGLVPELNPESRNGLSITWWAHQGLGIGTLNPWYRSVRGVFGPIDSQTPEGYTDPANVFEADLGAGVIARVPTALFADSEGTLPHRASVATNDLWTRTAGNRATRLADVIIAWNVFQHFYPYFDSVQVDMPTELRSALSAGAEDFNASEFAGTLRRLVAAIHDGHGYVSYNGLPARAVPLVWAWVEDQLVVTRSKETPLQTVKRGDRIVTIGGTPVETVIALAEKQQSGATPQWIRYQALRAISNCGLGGVMHMEIEPYATPGTVVPLSLRCSPADGDWSEPRPDTVAEIEPGILYVDINRLTRQQFTDAIPQLEAASGIVFDFRGYPRIWPPAFIQHLTKSELRSEEFYVPTPELPDQIRMTYGFGYWTLPPLDPYFAAKRVFLIDTSAISQAETDLDLVEHYKLAELVGEPTAGTTGDVNPFRLPGGFQVTFTGLRVLKPGGEPFHGVGIRPTFPVHRTRDGIAAGRDEILQKGLDVLAGR